MNNREVLAKNISKRFIAAISGNDKSQIIKYNPEDRIYVGKLSPQNKESDFSSSVLIKQIGVEFRIPAADIDTAILKIYPQGNFFFRVIPTLSQQQDYFLEDFNLVFKKQYKNFEELVRAYDVGELTSEMKKHKVQLLPVYEKIAIDRANVCFVVEVKKYYDPTYPSVNIPGDDEFYKQIEEDVKALSQELAQKENIIPCKFRDKLIIDNLINEAAWEKYILKQKKREEIRMFTAFNYSLAVDFTGIDDYISITVTLSNETNWEDETQDKGQAKAKNDRYRISTLFNSGIKVSCEGTNFLPIELEYFADDYKYDKNVYALGNNCNVEYDDKNCFIQTTHVPQFIQYRLKTRDDLAVSFDDLIERPSETLNRVYTNMCGELSNWISDLATGNNPSNGEKLTNAGKIQFQKEIEDFKTEIKRFKTGVELIEKYNVIRTAFCYMNQTFKMSAKGYSTWRLFQIVFIVSLILDIVANEPELMLEEALLQKAKTNDVDILYFPTGGGKTEAFLGIMVFNLFFDRIRGKEQGVTAILKYPLRLLSVQQVQRVSNILAAAEIIRRNNSIAGDKFALGYFVGEHSTPNSIDEKQAKAYLEMSQDELDESYKLLDICPYCGKPSVHVKYDAEKNSLVHICDNQECQSKGIIPLYMVDDDVYRFLPSVIISTVDKMTAIGNNSYTMWS